MDVTQVSEVLREGVFVALRVGAPLLILSLLVGVSVAIFQAITQIHEQTIGFALKLAMVILVCLVWGSNMLQSLVDYSRSLFSMML